MTNFPPNYLTVSEVVEQVRRGIRGEIPVTPVEGEEDVMRFGDMEVSFTRWDDDDSDAYKSVSSAEQGDRSGATRSWKKNEKCTPMMIGYDKPENCTLSLLGENDEHYVLWNAYDQYELLMGKYDDAWHYDPASPKILRFGLEDVSDWPEYRDGYAPDAPPPAAVQPVMLKKVNLNDILNGFNKQTP